MLETRTRSNAAKRCLQLTSIFSAAALLLAVFASPALAVPVNHGTFNGTTITYENVTEDNTRIFVPVVGPPVFSSYPTVYNAPTVSGDALLFSSTNFSVAAAGGASDFLDSFLTTRMVAKAGNFIAKVQWAERGDYTLIGGAGNFVQVSAAYHIRIEETTNGPIAPLSVSGNLVMTPSGGDFFSPGENGVAKNWQGSMLEDLDAILAANSISGRVTKATFSIDNVLVAQTVTGGTAFLKKKQEGLFAELEVVPEPSSLVLAGLGLVALVGIRLRKR